jgi:hypothetical protein
MSLSNSLIACLAWMNLNLASIHKWGTSYPI